MPFVKNKSYRDQPFCKGVPHGDFCIYYSLKDLTTKCLHSEEIIKCRTIGILQSCNGRFYLTSIDSPNDLSEPKVQVSMAYIKTPPKSTVIPYPVQVFGTLQWKKRPVIFATIIMLCLAWMFFFLVAHYWRSGRGSSTTLVAAYILVHTVREHFVDDLMRSVRLPYTTNRSNELSFRVVSKHLKDSYLHNRKPLFDAKLFQHRNAGVVSCPLYPQQTPPAVYLSFCDACLDVM